MDNSLTRSALGETVAPPTPLTLSSLGRTHHEQNAALRAAGPAVLLELPRGVLAWAVPRHDVLRALLADPRVGKNPRHWAALAEGRVPADWPLINFALVPGMITADGADHRRLRNLVGQAFTPRRVESLRPRIEAAVGELLDALAALPDGQPVDLRAQFALPLPVRVICDLVGLPEDRRDRMHQLSESVLGLGPGKGDAAAAQGAMLGLLSGLVELRRREPADDLTTALLAAQEADGSRLSEDELVGTLLALLVAGHETTVNLIDNAVRALLGRPGQLALVMSGERSWSDVVEETLRWDSPVNHFPLRYALDDIEIGGTVIRRGDAILASYAAAGRDEEEYGATADEFDVSRGPVRHLSFGHGPHFCLGAPLARLEAEVALSGLFSRFPGLRPAVADEELPFRAGIVSHGLERMPVLLASR